MAVQQEIKSQLAKLLATEDLVVEHKQCETAQFNVHTRVLTLPMWEKASDRVYDMLVSHEVGHALFTPDQDPPKDIPHDIVNVCEDARIEKLMKRKYMGIAKTFYRGYTELSDKDFFQIENENIDTFNLADRINLYYKIGSFVDIPFTTSEKEIVDLVGSAETFEDMENAARVVYQYCMQEQESEKEHMDDAEEQMEMESKAPDLGEDNTEYEDQEGEETESDKKPSQSIDMENGSIHSDQIPEFPKDIEVQTAESLEERLKDLVNTQGHENVYTELPKVNLDTIIAKNSEVHAEIDEYYNARAAEWDKDEHRLETDVFPKGIFDFVDSDFNKFKRDAQKEVNYLVKEFESRKAASSYARAATSRTGVLDTAKLHTYRYNEDLFKKITVLPDGKNHGLVFILDWSGSMNRVMLDTIKQLYNLVWFCRKVSIPFEVYAFSNEWYSSQEYYGRDSELFKERIEHYEGKEGHLHVDNKFALMNMLTSKVNSKTLEHQMINVWRLATSFGSCMRYGGYPTTFYNYPRRLSLSGTPLNESLVALHQILPHFQKQNKVEKVQCIILTDGEAYQLPYRVNVKRHWENDEFLGCRNCNGEHSFLRDRTVGKTYRFGWSYHEFSDALLKNLKDKFPTVNFIGIRVIEKRDALRFARMYHMEYTDDYSKIERDWKKQKSFTITKSGYDAYFALSSDNLADDAEFEVQEDATKAQIKRAFVKSLKTKKLNKKVLGEFISLVA